MIAPKIEEIKSKAEGFNHDEECICSVCTIRKREQLDNVPDFEKIRLEIGEYIVKKNPFSRFGVDMPKELIERIGELHSYFLPYFDGDLSKLYASAKIMMRHEWATVATKGLGDKVVCLTSLIEYQSGHVWDGEGFEYPKRDYAFIERRKIIMAAETMYIYGKIGKPSDKIHLNEAYGKKYDKRVQNAEYGKLSVETSKLFVYCSYVDGIVPKTDCNGCFFENDCTGDE